MAARYSNFPNTKYIIYMYIENGWKSVKKKIIIPNLRLQEARSADQWTWNESPRRGERHHPRVEENDIYHNKKPKMPSLWAPNLPLKPFLLWISAWFKAILRRSAKTQRVLLDLQKNALDEETAGLRRTEDYSFVPSE